MLDFLPRKVSVSASSPSTSSPTESEDVGMDVFSLIPLAAYRDDAGHYSRSGAHEPSLRQRGTTSTAASQSSPSLLMEEDGSLLANSEGYESKSSNSPSLLRSFLGGSPFLMGPHTFSTSEVLLLPRAHTESDRKGDLQTDLDLSLSSKRNVLQRRGSTQSQLLSSTSSRDSPCLDVDVESRKYSSASDEISTKVTSSSTGKRKQPKSYQTDYAFVIRSRENVIIHFLMEFRMLSTDYPLILLTIFMQWFHSVITNIAYWQHAQLSAANRVPLKDFAFEMLPLLDGKMWIISEYIFCIILGVAISCIVSNLFVKWNAPHGRPIYCVQILRRLGMTLICCLILRMISFLVTTLPGASRQCRYSVPDGMTPAEMLNGPAPGEGNPSGYAPPTDLHDIAFRIDATTGCGDLMFSSHTIFTMTFVCTVFKYFNFKWLKLIMALSQISMIPFILAARKHYSIDVFTALYVTPLVFEILCTRFPDHDTSLDLAGRYGIRFYLAQDGHDSFCYVVSLGEMQFSVDQDELPVDIQQGRHHIKGFSLPLRKGEESPRTTPSHV